MHTYGIFIYSVCRLYASRYVERLLKERRSEISARRQGDTNYRNLRVFPIIYTSWDRGSWHGVYHYSHVDYWRLFVSFYGDWARRERVARRFTHVKYYGEKSDVCINRRDCSPNRTDVYSTFPLGKFITRLIEYRRMRSEKYYG